jgi:hypothetical protein
MPLMRVALVSCVLLQAIIKPQYVDHIPKAVRGNVATVLTEKDQRGVKANLLLELDLEQVGAVEVGAGAHQGGQGGPSGEISAQGEESTPAACRWSMEHAAGEFCAQVEHAAGTVDWAAA